MSAIHDVKEKIQRILTNEFGRVAIDDDGDFVVVRNSAQVFIGIIPGFGDDGVIITVRCPLVRNVEMTDELCRWVATEGHVYKIGTVILNPNEDGKTGWLFFQNNIIGDDLDPSELIGSVLPVLVTSDDLDNELQARFGGELFGEEPSS